MAEPTTVDAVAILPLPEDRLLLSEIFRQSSWQLDMAESLGDGRVLLNDPRKGVVLTGCHLPDGGWRDVLHEVERRPIHVPPVIVVSRVADERLWAEVLNLRGYDVLATPFHADEVRWAIQAAWRHWLDDSRLRARGAYTSTSAVGTSPH